VVVFVLDNDTDADPDDTLKVTAILWALDSGPWNGIVTINPGETDVTYTPDPAFNGLDSFVYQVCDSYSACQWASVSITVVPVNDGPEAFNDAATTIENDWVVVSVLDNDADADTDDTLKVTAITSGPSNGTVIINSKETFVTYTPDLDFNGLDSFVYQVCDSSSVCDTATVSITVVPVNDGPEAFNDAATTIEDEAVVVYVLDNDVDTDPDDTLKVTAITLPSNGTVIINPGETDVSYTPNPGFNGTDSFLYQVCDSYSACQWATVSITVIPPDNGGGPVLPP
jgi:hypothetical protein